MLKGFYLTLMFGPAVPVPALKPVMDAFLSVQVTNGGTRGAFQIQFGISKQSPLTTAMLPAGYFETVQVLPNTQTQWQTWKAKQTGASTSADYTAVTPGKYKFRARLTGPSGSTIYSTARTTTVS